MLLLSNIIDHVGQARLSIILVTTAALLSGCFLDSRINKLQDELSSTTYKPKLATLLIGSTYINQNNVNNFHFNGECSELESIKIVIETVEFNSSCQNSTWSLFADLTSLPEQTLLLKIIDPTTGQILNSSSIIKDTQISAPAAINDMNFSSTNSTSDFYWDPVTTDQTGIVDYQIAIGTSPGDTSLLNWFSVGLVSKFIKSGLSGLTSGVTYYTSLRSTDLAGNVSVSKVGNGWIAVDKWKSNSSQIVANADEIHQIVATPDGGALAVGDIDSTGSHYNRGIKIGNNGLPDTLYTRGTGFNNRVFDSAIQPDGKIVIVGWFTEYNGNKAVGIVRLNSDGSIDPTFLGGQGATNAQFEDVAISPDGTILVSGWPTNYNGVATTAPLLKLNSDGTLIGSFAPNINSDIYSLAIQTDGKILIGGDFTSVGGTARARIARINSDGTLDTSFNPGTGLVGGYPYKIIPLSTGKILIGGGFTSYAGVTSNKFARANSDGSIDATFVIGTGFDSTVYDILVDGTTYYVGGYFTTYKGVPSSSITKLNDVGTMDTVFAGNVGSGAPYAIFAVSKNANGHIMVGGEFDTFNGIAQLDLVWLNTDGTKATGYPTGNVFNWLIKTIKTWPDGTSFVGGYFDKNNWSNAYSVLKLDSQFSIDPSFTTLSANGDAFTAAMTVGGKYLIGGAFTTYGIAGVNRIVKLNTDGTRDTSFISGAGFDGIVRKIIVDPSDNYIIGGDFTTFQGGTANKIIRLTSTGSVDPSFTFGTGFNNTVYTLARQTDGKILVGGNFTLYNSTSVGRVVRLNSDGTIDTSFISGTGFNGIVKSIVVIANEKILVGGQFTNYDGTACYRIIQLNSNGSIDPTFTLPNLNSNVNTIAVQTDGKILLAGDFTLANGQPQSMLLKLNSDGSIDSTFNSGSGPSRDIIFGTSSARINTLGILSSGEIAIGGYATYHFDSSFSGFLYKIGW